jgi:hypothetical protein
MLAYLKQEMLGTLRALSHYPCFLILIKMEFLADSSPFLHKPFEL